MVVCFWCCIFLLFAPHVRFHILVKFVYLSVGPPIRKIAAHSAYDMFS